MSTNATTTSPSAAASPLNLTAIIQPWVNTIMIGHTFLTLLVPLFIALFYFSTPQSRKRPIFILNVIVIILAFIAGVMIDALAIHSMLSIENPWPPALNIAIGIIGAFQNIIVDLILLLRLISVHPLTHVGPSRFATLTALPILLKIARFTNMFIFIKVMADASRGPQGAENLIVVWSTTPYLKIEWSCQMVDNTYASLAFLWTIRDRGYGQGVTSNIHPNKVTFAQRMRTLSRIALSNFIIPTLFSIAQLVVVYRSVNVLIVNEIVFVNTMVAVFGVVFATVWAGTMRRREAEVEVMDDASDGMDEKKGPRAFAYPGLGTWKAASVPPTLTFASSDARYAATQTGLATVDKLATENRNTRGVFVVSESRGADESLEVKMVKEDVII